MEPLKIEDFMTTGGTITKKIDGFTERELFELECMDYREMKQVVLDTLDKLNDGIGTKWQNGHGVLSMWIRGNSVYVEIDNTCG